MKLKGKKAIVTGGSNGMGAAICKLFSDEGADVTSVDITKPETDTGNVKNYELDITDSEACKSFYEDYINIHDHVDILVNNAGITSDALTKNMTDEQWDKVVDVDLKGIFNLTRLFGPHMEKRGSGSIVNISSAVGVFGNIGQANYAAAKAGVIGLTKSWAKEFSRKGANVRVNCIAPGYIMTDMIRTVPKDLLDKFKDQTMLKRIGQPEEIAKVTLFLACDDSSYITGETLTVTGGLRL